MQTEEPQSKRGKALVTAHEREARKRRFVPCSSVVNAGTHELEEKRFASGVHEIEKPRVL
jgi:hypothetical protein